MPPNKWPVEVDRQFGCWLWRGKVSDDGYGLIWRGDKPVYAHRVVYADEVAPIGEGLVVDHLCRRRNCVCPLHLEPIEKVVNQWRKNWATRARQAKCRNGHDLKLYAVITPEGGRLCRVCQLGR